ncbi:MAG TPA: NlpC/P60 family protein [Miltoncostaeaceae bacterium]|nr:NlpC/P60 family protein [Miltoncostaeaceae bacterium]
MRSRSSIVAAVVAAAMSLAVAAVLLTPATPRAAGSPAAIRAKRAELERIQAQMDQLDAQVESAAEAYNGAQYTLGLAQDRIDENARKARQTAKDIRARRDLLAERLRRLYATPEPSFIQVLLETGSVTEAADEQRLLDEVSRQDADVVDGLRRHRAELATLREQLVADRQVAAQQVAARAREQARVEELLRQRKAVFASADADLRRLLKEEKERREREAAAAAALARARQAATSITSGVPLTTTVPGGTANATAARLALNYLGVPYVWGGASPSGFDCSGLASYVYAQVGKSVPHYTGAIWAAFPQVASSDLQPGDLVFFYALDHVGIYLGGDQFVHAPHTGDVVKVSQLSTYPSYAGAVRP